MEGWIKIHRKMIEWQKGKDASLVNLFLYLMLKTSNNQSTYKGEVLNAGQTIITSSELEKQLGLTRQLVRTLIDKLIAGGEISVSTKPKLYQIVTINNFAKYQSKKDKITKKKQGLTSSSSDGYDDEKQANQPRANQENNQENNQEKTSLFDSLSNDFDLNYKKNNQENNQEINQQPTNHSLYIKELKEKSEKKDKNTLSFDKKEKIEKIKVRENVALTPSQIEKVVARMGGEKNADLVFDILMAWKLKKGITLENDREDDFGRILKWVYMAVEEQQVNIKKMAKNSLKLNEVEIKFPSYKKFKPNV